ncbi:hypothetical protein DPMN_172915 [Dreissena polymorpha]|uniref:Uncharacterized protein n=1 Tax=Dreissena polymorpha TaxID=45954 RepID=A0A9D4IF16_DREPO|nr:hypothetical protein DPMN_172915 [Dreissena polymorpha]
MLLLILKHPGPLSVQLESARDGAVVAGKDDEVLLGLDVLAGEKYGKAGIFLSKSVNRLKGKEIPLIPATKMQQKVTVEDVAILELSKVVVDVYVDRNESDGKCKEENFVIEPAEENVNRAVTSERTDGCTWVIANEESEGERGRVQLKTVETDSNITDLLVANAKDMPPHLKSLVEESVVGKTEEP